MLKKVCVNHYLFTNSTVLWFIPLGGPTTPASAVGQRRPVVTHNFVPGGQVIIYIFQTCFIVNE